MNKMNTQYLEPRVVTRIPRGEENELLNQISAAAIGELVTTKQGDFFRRIDMNLFHLNGGETEFTSLQLYYTLV